MARVAWDLNNVVSAVNKDDAGTSSSNKVSSSSSSTNTSIASLQAPSVTMSIKEVDKTDETITYGWTVKYRTAHSVVANKSNDNPYAFVGVYVKKSGLFTKEEPADSKYPVQYPLLGKKNNTDHVMLEGRITFDKGSLNASEVTFILKLTWHNAKITSGSNSLVLSDFKDITQKKNIPKKTSSTADILDDLKNALSGSNTTDTGKTPLWTADWSTAVIFDMDGSAATSAPPKPTAIIEADENGDNPTLVITVNKADVFDSNHRVKLIFEVIKDDTERRYSGDDVVVYSDEDLIITPELTTRLPVELGSVYNVRCRTVKIVGDKEYESEWSEWSADAKAGPLAPEAITVCRAASSNDSDVDSIYLEWTASKTAKSYDIQYSTNKDLLDDSDSTETKNTGDVGTKYTITGFGGDKSGKEYFIRVRAVGENNTTSPWSGIVSVVLGSKPGAPTTWSSQSTITVGEPVNLYWVHNSMDGSKETYANLTVYIDKAIKFLSGMEVYKDYCYTDGSDRYLCIRDSEAILHDALTFISGTEVVEGYYYTDGTDKYLCIQNGLPESLTDESFFTKVNENPLSLTDTTFFEKVADDYGVEKICDSINIFRTIKFKSGMSVSEGRYYTDGTDKYLCIKNSTDIEAPTTLLDETFFSKVDGGYDEDEVSYYTLETPEHIFSEGARVKWLVATAGITNVLGPQSTPRLIDVYSRPSVQLAVTSYVDGEESKFDTLTRFPIHVKALAYPKTQTPIGYYLSVTAKSSYTTRDALGNPKVVREGDVVYYRYFDTSEALDTHLSAGDIALENNVSYKLSCVVSMNSGLSAEGTAEFTVAWSTEQHFPTASIAINTNVYAVAIHPYCEENTTVWHTVNKESDGRYTVGSEVLEDVGDIVPLVKSVKSLGKNLLNITTIVEQRNCEASSINGVLSITKSNKYVAYARLMSMYLTAGTKYVLSYTASSSAAKIYWWKADDSHYDDANDELVVVGTSKTFTPSESGYYCIAFGHGGIQGSTITIRNAQVEAGSKATAYEDYQGVDVILEKTSTGVDIYTSGDNYYCMLEESKLVDDVTLSVYRREYDGSFTEIAKDVPNQNVYIPDPHPSLDYARYRIVATSQTTGYVSYYDLPNQYIGCKSVVIQWNEEWNDFDADKGRTTENTWTGSMLVLPYNIDVTDSRSIEVEMVKYIGRKHPVSYYGTQLGETASWSCAIPKTDKETLYALRRLATWAGDVYVREPSGVGYWANVVVNFSQKHCDPVVPVSFEITRVEGGM